MRRALSLPAVLLPLLVGGVACHSESNEAGVAHQSNPSGGPYEELVHAQESKPLAERMAVYLPMARRLQLGGKSETLEGYLSALVRGLLLARDFAVLEALERELDDPERKWVLWATVSTKDPTPAARRLLEQWAQAHPEEVILARHRPGGIEFLLSTLEDETRSPPLRARCASELVRAGDSSVIPRLRKLVDDETPVSLRSLRAGSGVPTLGEIVQKCIQELERPG